MAAKLRTEFLGEVNLVRPEPQASGAAPGGIRQFYSVTGGTFEGPRFRGEILPGGGDWFLLRPDGTGETDVRCALRTDDGHLIYLHYRGILHAPPDVMARLAQGEAADASGYYLRATPVFETASEKYAWLNHLVTVGVGRLAPNWVGYLVYALL